MPAHFYTVIQLNLRTGKKGDLSHLNMTWLTAPDNRKKTVTQMTNFTPKAHRRTSLDAQHIEP